MGARQKKKKKKKWDDKKKNKWKTYGRCFPQNLIKTINPQIKKLNKPQVQETGKNLHKVHCKQNA